MPPAGAAFGIPHTGRTEDQGLKLSLLSLTCLLLCCLQGLSTYTHHTSSLSHTCLPTPRLPTFTLTPTHTHFCPLPLLPGHCLLLLAFHTHCMVEAETDLGMPPLTACLPIKAYTPAPTYPTFIQDVWCLGTQFLPVTWSSLSRPSLLPVMCSSWWVCLSLLLLCLHTCHYCHLHLHMRGGLTAYLGWEEGTRWNGLPTCCVACTSMACSRTPFCMLCPHFSPSFMAAGRQDLALPFTFPSYTLHTQANIRPPSSLSPSLSLSPSPAPLPSSFCLCLHCAPWCVCNHYSALSHAILTPFCYFVLPSPMPFIYLPPDLL